jgi:hypothetical protein
MYLDPGSWSLAIQVIFGAVLSIPLLIGVYWGRIKAKFFGGKVRNRVVKE